MSANNFIEIKEGREGFTVTMLDDDTHLPTGGFKTKAKTLREAIRLANERIYEGDVEYGLSIHLKEE